MSYHRNGSQYAHWPCDRPTGYDEQYPGDYNHLSTSEYSDCPDSAFHSPAQSYAEAQRGSSLGIPWASTGTNAIQWNEEAYGNQDVDPQWNFHSAPYSGSGVHATDDYRNNYRNISRHVYDNYPSQNTPAAAQQYATGSSMATGAQNWREAYSDGRVPQQNYSYAPQTSMGRSQYAQSTHGTQGYPRETPVLRVDAPQENHYTHISRSASSVGDQADSGYAFSAATSPHLSPYLQAEGEDEQSSASSPTPDPQAPPSPSGPDGNDEPDRKWKCKQLECAERKGFKRHADLMRHMTTVHHKENMEKFACPRRGCPRKAENGFTRRDHLVEHLRNFHVQDIPKRKGGRGKGRE